MTIKNIFIQCPNCNKTTTTDFPRFLNSAVFVCPQCKADVIAGKEGINLQIKHYIEDKQFNIAIFLHRVVSGDSLSKSKLYIQNLSKSMGIEMKSKLKYKTLFIFSIITGLVLTYIISYFFYPKFVYIISNDLFGMKTRGVTTSSYFVASLFYGVVVFILLIIKGFIKKVKLQKMQGQVKIPEQVKVPEQIKVPEQKDFRGNAF